MSAAEIEQQIRERYGSLEQPDFHFVGNESLDGSYEDLISRLAETFAIEEITDPNDDVSLSYVLRRDGGEWVVQLSLVGPYAVLLRLTRGAAEVVTASVRDLARCERLILEELERSGLKVLDRSTLSRPIPLRLFNTAPDSVRLYQALFTDTDVLPWETHGAP